MLKRRTFLARSGSLLAALGLSGGSLAALSDRYATALAQPVQRKRALLVGINQYAGVDPQNTPWLHPLQGCLTDVEMQRELLLYRFGFAPADIVTLTDGQATRQALIDTILGHLIEPCQPDDLVVLHFSGYGGQGCIPVTKGTQRRCTPLLSLVPTDSLLGFTETAMTHDLVESTLTHLVQAIPAQTVLLVLDTSYALTSQNPNPAQRSRSRILHTGINIPEVQPAKILWPQSRHLSPTEPTPTTLKETKAVVLQAAQVPDSSAVGVGDQAFEMQGSGFSAGAFTYALTQHLWANTTAQQTYLDFGAVRTRLQTWTTQIPYQIRPSKAPQWTFPTDGIEGVVTAVEDSHLEISLWLGGIDPVLLPYVTPNVPLQLWPESIDLQSDSPAVSEKPPTYLQVRSREGLVVKAKLVTAANPPPKLQLGQGVREVVRLISKVGLTIALDASLGRVERVDATSALANIPYINGIVTNDQQADCRLGHVPSATPIPAPNPDVAAPPPSKAEGDVPTNRYGLLSPDRVPITTTLCDRDEAIAGATRRLIPHFQALLAAKQLRLLVNHGVSLLPFQVTLTWLLDQQPIPLVQETRRAIALMQPPLASPAPQALNPSRAEGQSLKDPLFNIPQGAHFHLQVQNLSQEHVSVLLLGLDPLTGQMMYFPTMLSATEPNQAQTSLESSLLAQGLLPNQHSHYPTSSPTQSWSVAEKPGQYRLYLIAARAPFIQTGQKLGKQVSLRTALQEMPIVLNDPLTIAQALFQDLDQASLPLSTPALLNALKETSIPEDVVLHVGAWAGFEFSYTVTA